DVRQLPRHRHPQRREVQRVRHRRGGGVLTPPPDDAPETREPRATGALFRVKSPNGGGPDGQQRANLLSPRSTAPPTFFRALLHSEFMSKNDSRSPAERH